MTAERALAVVDPRRLDELLADPAPARLHLGSEFCETLLPSPRQVNGAVAAARARGIGFALVTPMLSEAGMARLDVLLPLLPEGAEVVANDWGTLRLLRGRAVEPVAGRLLCKMIKDPRLPSAEWARLYPHGIHSTPFRRLLERLGVRRIEMDVPPFAAPGDFRSPGMKVAVHAPYGYSVKGRACKIGSLRRPDADKFRTGHDCAKECLAYVGVLSRPQTAAAELETFQRGNVVLYRHSPAMAEAVDQAVAQGWVDRIVIAGDWHADRRPD